jgi:chemotaxis protein methyltransferase WspC
MNVEAVETWLQAHAGLDAATLGAGVVAGAARVRIAATGCARVEDYLARLENSADERHALIDRVIVPETWFFRDRPALDALARHVVETWGPAHPGATFRVLSVPCSTGEEPYSLAMAFALAGWPLEFLRIDAVDISRENLTRGREGVYGRNSFRGDDLEFRAIFLELAGSDGWRVAERMRGPVRFEQGNLLAEDFSLGRTPYDAIFCRNLLIYFDRPTQARAIRALDRLLVPEGWLAVGPAEPVLLFEHGYEALRVPGSFMLRRAPAEVAAPPPPPRRSFVPAPWPAPRKSPVARVAPVAITRPAPAAAAPEEISLEELQRLADAGRLIEATERGEALLARHGASAELLFLLAVVAEAAGQAARAESLYRKTLYLAPQHAEALAHLALLAEKNGDVRGARAFRDRAQRVLLKEVR